MVSVCWLTREAFSLPVIRYIFYAGNAFCCGIQRKLGWNGYAALKGENTLLYTHVWRTQKLVLLPVMDVGMRVHAEAGCFLIFAGSLRCSGRAAASTVMSFHCQGGPVQHICCGLFYTNIQMS